MRKFVENVSFKGFKLKENLRRNTQRKRKGAFAFEYIIVLVIMVVLIFTAFDRLSILVMDKVAEIEEAMTNNPLSNTGGLGGGS